MSKAKTRTQYVYLEVKKPSNAHQSPSATLCGPATVLFGICRLNFKNDNVTCQISSLGNTTEIKLTGPPLTFMKASLLEEVLSLGFVPLSSIKEDSLTLFREVTL
ncbi:Hypothetical predicted protein [Paramuricea clavata]|uniref:Uncharacterized protein n=1 Tax=Paramuricea clavata TaxID=317549 RepID=A0A7D9D4H1_PARCT|nr:Hypothetical predicted protein [Paramuricea clavata]